METLGCVKKCMDIFTDPKYRLELQFCVTKCAFTYGDKAFDDVLSCLDKNKCLKLPGIKGMCKGPDKVKLQKNITIKDLAGATLWTLRGYNRVYDCYYCQVLTFALTTYISTFDAALEDGSLKSVEQNGTITDLSPQPGFNVTITAGLTLVNTFWVFDQVDQYFLVYYCGYGNTWNYEGALVLSTLKEISASAMPLIKSSFDKSVGIDFDKMCKPYSPLLCSSN